MTEREKMTAGLPYYAGDPELVELRTCAKDLCHAYNLLPPRDEEGHDRLRVQLLGGYKQLAYMEPPVYFDYGFNTVVGENFYANYNLTILDCAPVTIGDNVMFGPGVQIYTVGHPLDAEQRNSGIERGKPIHVGDNVWIGGNTVLNPGVTIGDNTVIGSGSVVTKDIPANVLAAGNPCRVIREITPEDRERF